ncbi:MAG: hypothetical protein ACLFUB_20155 [Cyclobacteriaceae bacterium]
MKRFFLLFCVLLSVHAQAQVMPATEIDEGVYYLRFDQAEAVILVHPDLEFIGNQRFAESILYSQQAKRSFKRPLVVSWQGEDTVMMLGSDNVKLLFYRKENQWILKAPPKSEDTPLLLLSASHMGWRDKFDRVRKFKDLSSDSR